MNQENQITPPSSGEARPSAEMESLRLEFFDLIRRVHQYRPMSSISVEGATPTEARALHVIFLMETQTGVARVRPGCVAQQMHVTPSAMSQVLRTLSAKGLVERGRDGDDYRAVAVRLTESGRALAEKVDSEFSRRACELVEYVGVERMRAMVETMNLITEFQLERQEGTDEDSSVSARP